MTEESIIESWKKGYTVEQIAKEYMSTYNKKITAEQKKISKTCARRIVEPVIFSYQTSITKGVDRK